MKKRLFAGTAAVIIAAVSFLPLQARALSAEKAIVLDGATGRVVFEKNADAESLIASTTKIMTALIVCEQCNVLDRMRIPREAVGIEGSSMYLREGEVLTIQELLYGLMLCSGNDAAVALAVYCGGTVEGFAELMNDKARVLGLSGTHFVNPNGLDAPDHHSTARDLAKLTAYAMENPIFHKTVSAKTVTVGERYLRNHNKLLWMYPDADGVKTGYTRAAGRILVSSASRNGRRLVAVTINAPDDWNDHMAMLNDGFDRFQIKRILSRGDVVGKVAVAGGQAGYAELLAGEDFDFALTEGEQVELSLPGPGFAYAPVAEGGEAGMAHVMVDGKAVARIPLVFGRTVEQIPEEPESFFHRLFRRD